MLTSMPVTSCRQVFPLSDRPAKSMSVPEDVPVLVCVLVHWPLGGPLNPLTGDDVLAVAVGVRGSEDVEGLAHDRRHPKSLS